MHQPVQDRVCQRIFAYAAIPFVRRQLAYHYRGIFAVSVVHYLQQIITVNRRQGGQTPVVQDPQLGFRQVCQLFFVASVRPTVCQFNQQAAQTPVLYAVALNRTGFFGEFLVRKLRLPDHYLHSKHNRLFRLLPAVYVPAVPVIVDC